MSEAKSILIIGGSAGAKIATNIFKLTHPHYNLYYVECFADEIITNRLYSTVEKSLEHLLIPNVEYFIATGDIIHVDATIGNCTIINTSSVVEHDCQIGDFTQISPNTTLCGYVKVGENCFISAGSTLIPKVEVGDNSIVAAGSVVIDHVPPNVMVAGIPSKVKKVYKL